ncbi:hypothetical protein MtrunA17_Chr1g0195551 [Medicago truncatula]|uniref:Uncharacterized protein n=1 Tax=Medicago truncatula TaxID=3880 RepID=A0A072VMI0_MEDTR|nr:hypothetical protein MTR_1g088535 [Medicago truncatula]RHN81117.1 hypothetical protein MtrunA17_Chr1g0195551 [Medicago truncatula]
MITKIRQLTREEESLLWLKAHKNPYIILKHPPERYPFDPSKGHSGIMHPVNLVSLAPKNSLSMEEQSVIVTKLHPSCSRFDNINKQNIRLTLINCSQYFRKESYKETLFYIYKGRVWNSGFLIY